MALLISKKEFNNSQKKGFFFLNIEKFTFFRDQYLYCIIGEIFSHTNEEVIMAVIDNNRIVLDGIIGDFSLVLFDDKNQEIKILNDKAGRHLLYYSTKTNITISSDFWSVIRHEKYTVEDIDLLTFKTQVFFSATPDCKTLFKELRIFPNATISSYLDEEMKIDKYWYFSLHPNNLTRDQKYDQIEYTLNDCFKSIKKSNPKDAVYGVGISGGIDSRIIPYYALKHDMKLKSFIVGQEKPHLFWSSNDHIASDLIVDKFNLEHQKLEYNELSYREKLNIEVEKAPLVTSQIFKIPNLHKLNFDVLLTGASGFFVGSSPFYSKIRGKDIVNIVCTQQSDLNIRRKFHKIRKGINYILGKRIFEVNPIIVKSLPGIISESEVKSIQLKIKEFFSDMRQLNDTEKLMNYALSVLGQRNKKGSFESLLGEYKDYTPYLPFFIGVVQNWTEDEIYDRALFENFVKERLPDLATIKAQNHKTVLAKEKPSTFQKIKSLLLFVFRGTGVMNYPKWARELEFKTFVKEYFKEKTYVDDYFDIKKVKKMTYRKELDPTVLTSIVKLNEIIKKISKGEFYNNQ